MFPYVRDLGRWVASPTSTTHRHDGSQSGRVRTRLIRHRIRAALPVSIAHIAMSTRVIPQPGRTPCSHRYRLANSCYGRERRDTPAAVPPGSYALHTVLMKLMLPDRPFK